MLALCAGRVGGEIVEQLLPTGKTANGSSSDGVKDVEQVRDQRDGGQQL